MKQSFKIKCRKCKGTGRIDLDLILGGTLEVLADLKNATAQQVFESLMENNIGVVAVNKRLERLRDAGLVKRKKSGKSWIYQPL